MINDKSLQLMTKFVWWNYKH